MSETLPTELDIYGANALISPHLHIWGWEIPVYLFLGGMAAGFLVLSGLAVLLNRRGDWPFTVARGPLLVLPLLALGMGALFLDLAYKLHVFRFYTAFKVTSPMSWGSWILLLVAPAAVASVLVMGDEADARLIARLPFGRRLAKLRELAPVLERPIALVNVIVGAALGIYTGILLGAFGARPLWNSAILGPLFLASGMSAAAAVLHMFAPTSRERRAMARMDVAMLALEALFLGLLLLQLSTGNAVSMAAAALFLGGSYTAVFWVLVILIGILIPMIIQTLAVSGKVQHTAWAPLMVLIGGLALRTVIVYAGQVAEWRGY